MYQNCFPQSQKSCIAGVQSAQFFSSISVQKQRGPYRGGRWAEDRDRPSIEDSPPMGQGAGSLMHPPCHGARVGLARAFSAELSLLWLQRGTCLHAELLHKVSQEEQKACLIDATGGDTPTQQWAAAPTGA